MTITFYQYPGCSTCRKAAKWLDAAGVEARSVHLVEKTPSASKLKALWKTSGLPIRKFFNTSGNSYRNGGFKQKLETMTDAQALAALADDGMLIKRPILDTGDAVLVGFKEPDWQAAAG
jgi:arsenate reductase